MNHPGIRYQRIFLIRMHSYQIDEIKHPHHVYPPLLLKYMQALLLQTGRYQVTLVDTWLTDQKPRELLARVIQGQPEVVVLLTTSIEHQTSFEFGRLLKQRLACFLVAVGQEVGPHIERFRSPRSPFDVVLPGESELEILALLDTLNRDGPEHAAAHYPPANPLPSLVVEDLDRLPFPSYTPEEIESYCFSAYPLRMTRRAKWGFILGSRGCPYQCFFCSPITRKTSGTRIRTRQAAHVVDEIEHLMASGINVLSFEDDDMTAKRGHVVGLCQEIIKRRLRIKWICHARLDELDADLMRMMQAAGCILLRLGVESVSERILGLFGKNPQNKDWKSLCKTIFPEARRLGIATNALVIIGSPGETRAEIDATIDFVLDLNPDMVQVHFFTLYPGSRAYDTYKAQVSQDQIARMHHYNLPTMNLSRVPRAELWRLRSRFYRRFFLRPVFVAQHLYHYGLFYATNPNVFRQLSKVAGIL